MEAEREKREKILSLSFLSVCDDFCQKFFSLCNKNFSLAKIKRQKGETKKRRKFDHEFFPEEREERSRSFSD